MQNSQSAILNSQDMELRYNAIVLKKKEVGETDRLYTLYTEEAGKVLVVAKGVRKQEAKLAGQLETFTQSSIMVVRSRGTGKIVGALAEHTFPHLRKNLEVLERVLSIIHHVERLVGLEEKDQELFHLLLEYLTIGNDLADVNQKEKFFLLSEAFLFQLFAHLGYRIETGVCSVSGEKLTSGKQHFFSPSAGGMIASRHQEHHHEAFPISENAIKLIRLSLSNRLSQIPRVTVEVKDLREMRQISTHFFRWILR